MPIPALGWIVQLVLKIVAFFVGDAVLKGTVRKKEHDEAKAAGKVEGLGEGFKVAETAIKESSPAHPTKEDLNAASRPS